MVGKAERVSREESEAYYKTRPLGSRIGAWASPQSSIVADDEVAQRVKETEERFGLSSSTSPTTDVDIPLPDFWGGWRVIPECVPLLESTVYTCTYIDDTTVKSSSGLESHRGFMTVYAIPENLILLNGQ